MERCSDEKALPILADPLRLGFIQEHVWRHRMDEACYSIQTVDHGLPAQIQQHGGPGDAPESLPATLAWLAGGGGYVCVDASPRTAKGNFWRPKGAAMKFEDALAAMRDGKAVRRKSSWWSYTIKDRLNGGKRVEVSADGQQYSAYTFEVFDIVEADDWEVAA